MDYYKLNATFVGEFGCRALVAGKQGVPTVFLAGDDKACHEAEVFVPEIESVATKWGRGVEAAEHRDRDDAVDAVREGAARAIERIDDVPPLTGFDAPYELVVRYYDPVHPGRATGENVEQVDDRTLRIRAETLEGLRDGTHGSL